MVAFLRGLCVCKADAYRRVSRLFSLPWGARSAHSGTATSFNDFNRAIGDKLLVGLNEE